MLRTTDKCLYVRYLGTAMNRRKLSLIVIVAFNFIASLLHIVDNIVFFEHYPEPDWIPSPHIVDVLWIIATPFLFIGYWLFRRGMRWGSSGLLMLYGFMSLSVLGHYLYASPVSLSFRINFFILLEAVAALTLIVFVALVRLCWPSLAKQAT